jgi:hypothetical protein
MGHASITTTERYDNQKADALEAAARLLEGKVVQVLSSDLGPARQIEAEPTDESAGNPLEGEDLEIGVDDGTRTRNVRSHSPVLYL